jgi:hypothetical protein
MKKRLTLVIPNKDTIRYAKPALASICAQKNKDEITVIFVDESVDPFSRAYIARLCNYFNLNFEFLNPNQKGISNSVIHGFKLAETEYVAFFTLTDLVLDPYYYEYCLHQMDANHSLSYCHSNILTLRGHSLDPGLPLRYLVPMPTGTDEEIKFYGHYSAFGDGINELTAVFRRDTIRSLQDEYLSSARIIDNVFYSIFTGLFSNGCLGHLHKGYAVAGRAHPYSLTLDREADRVLQCSLKIYEQERKKITARLNRDKHFFSCSLMSRITPDDSRRLHRIYTEYTEKIVDIYNNSVRLVVSSVEGAPE